VGSAVPLQHFTGSNVLLRGGGVEYYWPVMFHCVCVDPVLFQSFAQTQPCPTNVRGPDVRTWNVTLHRPRPTQWNTDRESSSTRTWCAASLTDFRQGWSMVRVWSRVHAACMVTYVHCVLPHAAYRDGTERRFCMTLCLLMLVLPSRCDPSH
jgi:hypothetical protein